MFISAAHYSIFLADAVSETGNTSIGAKSEGKDRVVVNLVLGLDATLKVR